MGCGRSQGQLVAELNNGYVQDRLYLAILNPLLWTMVGVRKMNIVHRIYSSKRDCPFPLLSILQLLRRNESPDILLEIVLGYALLYRILDRLVDPIYVLCAWRAFVQALNINVNESLNNFLPLLYDAMITVPKELHRKDAFNVVVRDAFKSIQFRLIVGGKCVDHSIHNVILGWYYVRVARRIDDPFPL